MGGDRSVLIALVACVKPHLDGLTLELRPYVHERQCLGKYQDVNGTALSILPSGYEFGV